MLQPPIDVVPPVFPAIGAGYAATRDGGFCCLFSNSVLLVLPIAERAYGAEALTGNYAIVAFRTPFCYGVGITAMEFVRNRGKAPTQFAGSVLKAMLQNWPILGIVLGFIVNVTGLPIPQAIDDALGLIIAATLPGRSLRAR